MKISDTGIALIKELEGFRSKAYYCPAGKLTIGYGHTGNDFTKNDEITRERATQILMHDIKWAEDAINKRVKVPLNQYQFDALVSFVFNVGEKAFADSTLLLLLNKNQHGEVPAQMARWNKITVDGKKVISDGLKSRRYREAGLWLLSSNAPPISPQAVVSPDKPLVKSRTMANASVAGGVSVVLAAAPAIEPAGEVVRLVQESPTGFIYVVAASLAVFAAIAIYLRWDDKRKPS